MFDRAYLPLFPFHQYLTKTDFPTHVSLPPRRRFIATQQRPITKPRRTNRPRSTVRPPSPNPLFLLIKKGEKEKSQMQ